MTSGGHRRHVIAIVLEPAAASPSWRTRPPLGVLNNLAISDAAFVVGWEVQSQIATLILVSLVAFVSLWAALATMLVWSLVATVAYCHARERGLPDLVTVQKPRTGGGKGAFLRHAAGSAVKVWFVGLHNLVFARLAGGALGGLPCRTRRWRRLAVLSVGMTLFGVTTAEHLLRRAGFSGGSLLRFGLIGPFLNVPYRIFLSAAAMHGVMEIIDSVCGIGSSCL
jgi:hypothetical protein